MVSRSSKWIALCPWKNGYRGWAFRCRRATSDTNGSERLEKGRGCHVGQKNVDKAEMESPESMCYTGMPELSEDSGFDRTTATEAASL